LGRCLLAVAFVAVLLAVMHLKAGSRI